MNEEVLDTCSSPSRRQLLAAGVVLAAGMALPLKGATQVNSSNKPSIVFCHGIWADGSCFNKLIPSLRGDGYQVMAAQYGLDTVKSDVDAVIRTFARVNGPILLVGHSYGGAVITYAGMDPRVSALVYIAALCPDETETPQAQQEKFPQTDIFNHVEVTGGRVWLKPEGTKAFAGDLSAEDQGVVYATHFAPAADLFTHKLDGNAWKVKPSTYILATEDHTVHPELQRTYSKRMDATVVELKSSHVPMLSRPAEVLAAIRKAAAAVAAHG